MFRPKGECLTTVRLKESTNMVQKVIDFPSQIVEAYSKLANQRELPPEFKGKFSSIVVVGMGGSGVVGDFVRILLRNSRIRVHVCKNSRTPTSVNADTLVIAIPYSVITKETLE